MTTNIELSIIINKLNFKHKFLGVFMKDQLPPKQRGWLICNTEDSSCGGKHWVLCWQGDENVYFSSYGEPLLPECQKWLGKCITSDFQLQSFSEVICGELCVLVAYLMDNGCRFEDVVLGLLNESV